ncbi:MAG: PD40 domain-containing protein [candidate division Zixibacteria bacterium]|nr:PD40 domain-containing protein [candidate division Zixibacteria bacterium]
MSNSMVVNGAPARARAFRSKYDLFARRPILLLGILLLLASPVSGQEEGFGKNKVQYRDFHWTIISSDHFDIYYYENGYDLAVFAATQLESAYVTVSAQLNHRLSKRVPVILYQSHNEFQQTNITSSLLDEGVGGFTETFKNRMVMPFMGSYEEFRHVLHHELTHAVTFDLLYGRGIGSILSQRTLFPEPLWFAEGFAEYSSRHGWDTFADMVLRDATVHGYLVPLDLVDGYLAYKEGQSAILYLAERYGEEKIPEVLSKGRFESSLDNSLKKAIGMGSKEFTEEWEKRLRKEYWPEISAREEPKDFAKQLTDHEKDGSYFNDKPVFSPRGDRIAIFSERADYTEVNIISAVDGKRLRRVLKGGSTDRFESLHSFVSGMSFSPDGETIALIAKSRGSDALFLISVDGKQKDRTLNLGFSSMSSPCFSPDGKSIVVTARKDERNDLYLVDVASGGVTRLTDDRFDEQDVRFDATGTRIVFACDRPSDDSTPLLIPQTQDPVTFAYGRYNIFEADLTTQMVHPLTDDDAEDKTPVFAPDGRRVCYVSNKNGIYNLYLIDSIGAKPYPITDALSGCFSPAWSPDGQSIAFTAFFKAGFDVFLMKEIRPKVAGGGELAPTAFVRRLTGLDSAHFVLKKTPSWEERAPKILSEDLEFTSFVQKAETPLRRRALFSDSTQASDTGAIGGSPESTLTSMPLPPATDKTARKAVADTGSTSGHRGPPPGVTDSTKLASADTTAGKGPRQYVPHKYKLKFSPDLVTGGLGYSTFFGLRGQSYFVISDFMGDHQIFIATDLVNTIDQSNLQAYYLYSPKRIDYGFGIFHSKYYYAYSDSTDHLFSDRTYGFLANAARPFSKFTRLQLDGMMLFVDRKFLSGDPGPRGQSDRVGLGVLSLVHDDITWGFTGPANGRRYRASVEIAPDGLARHISYQAFTMDFRQYTRIGRRYSFAWRGAFGFSGGKTPKRFYLGGVDNWIGSTVVSNDIYDPEGLYFSQVITPLRGWDYYGLRGTRFALMNAELRFPFVDYFAMRFPLPMVLSQIAGVLFGDMGGVWDKNDFRGASTDGGFHLQDLRASFGYGLRVNLGIAVLRFDQAWRTDLRKIASRPKFYFSLGGDF